MPIFGCGGSPLSEVRYADSMAQNKKEEFGIHEREVADFANSSPIRQGSVSYKLLPKGSLVSAEKS